MSDFVTTGGGKAFPPPAADYEPVDLVLQEVEVVDGFDFGDGKPPKPQAKLVWGVLGSDTDAKIWDYATITVNDRPGGQPTNFKSLVNAIAGRRSTEIIGGASPSTLDYYLSVNPAVTPGAKPDGRIAPGARVTARGVNVPVKSGERDEEGNVKTRYKVSVYEPARKTPGASAPAAHPATSF